MKKISIICFTFSIIIFLASSVSSASQEISLKLIGSNFGLSTGSPRVLSSWPSVAFNSADNEFIVVWGDTRTGNSDVFGQRVSAMGMLLDGNIQITDAMGLESNPIVTYNTIDNQYLVAWKSRDGGGADFNDVFGRLVASDGALLSDAFHIFDGGWELSSSYNSNENKYFLTGRVFLSSSDPGIVGQIIRNSGALIGSQIEIDASDFSAPNGQVIYNPNINEYFATWRDQADQKLKGQRIAANGDLIGAAIVISPIYPAAAASVAFDPANDRYIVVFKAFYGVEILGQFVSSSGELIGETFQIASDPSETAYPNIAYSSIDNVFVVVWKEADDIVAQLVSDDGLIIGNTLIVAQGTAFGDPTLACNSETNGFLVVWPDDRNLPPNDAEVFAQLITVSELIEIDTKICPKILDLKSKKSIISVIKHFKGYGPHDIAMDSIELSIPSCSDCQAIYPTYEFPLKKRYYAFFPPQDLIDEIKTMNLDLPTNLDLKITGEFNDGTPFEGVDTIRVLHRKKWTKRK